MVLGPGWSRLATVQGRGSTQDKLVQYSNTVRCGHRHLSKKYSIIVRLSIRPYPYILRNAYCMHCTNPYTDAPYGIGQISAVRSYSNIEMPPTGRHPQQNYESAHSRRSVSS